MNSYGINYSPEELTELERLQAQMRGEVIPPPAMAPRPTEITAAQPMPPEPAPIQIPSMGAPALAPRKGMITGSVTTETNPYADRLMELNKQLGEQRMGTQQLRADTEKSIATDAVASGQKRATQFSAEEESTQRALAAQQDAKAKLQAEGQDWAARKDQPEKAFEGRRWASVAASIGIAAGVFSQAMGWQNGNPVREAFNKAIDDEVAAQREQKGSMLKQIEARLGDANAAESLLRAQLTDAKNNRLAAELQGETDQAKLARLAPLLKEGQDEVQQHVVNAYERLAPKQSETQVRPTPKGPGPARDLLKEIREKKLLRQELENNLEESGLKPDQVEAQLREYDKAGLTVSGKTTEQAAKELQTGLGVKKDVDSRRRMYSVEDTELADEETAMVATARALGGKYDTASGRLSLPNDLTGFGVGAALKKVPGTEAKAAHEAVRNLTDVKQRMRSGAAAPTAEVENFKRMTAGDNFGGLDESAVKGALNTVAASLYARRRGAMLGAGEDVLKSWEEEKKKLPTTSVPGSWR